MYAFNHEGKDQGAKIAKRAIRWIGHTPAMVRGQVATVCAGSFRTADRLKAAKIISDDACPHCKKQ